jgi:hypothetical protein
LIACHNTTSLTTERVQPLKRFSSGLLFHLTEIKYVVKRNVVSNILDTKLCITALFYPILTLRFFFIENLLLFGRSDIKTIIGTHGTHSIYTTCNILVDCLATEDIINILTSKMLMLHIKDAAKWCEQSQYWKSFSIAVEYPNHLSFFPMHVPCMFLSMCSLLNN